MNEHGIDPIVFAAREREWVNASVVRVLSNAMIGLYFAVLVGDYQRSRVLAGLNWSDSVRALENATRLPNLISYYGEPA